MLGIGDIQTTDIGIITPYNGQVRVLNDLFEQAGGREIGEKYSSLEIKSVDGYGAMKKVIVFSTVRANEDGEIGFLKDKRRMNVALTRAKRGLVVVGHLSTLKHDSTWSSWLDWVEESGCLAWHLSND